MEWGMIKDRFVLRWINELRIPRQYPVCQNCQHYAHSFRVGDDFVGGHFCAHRQDLRFPKKLSCAFFQRRNEGCVYGRETSPEVMDAYCFFGMWEYRRHD
jgi:hypothetical protein